MENFCYQCEQTAGGTGCTKVGVCGKDPRMLLTLLHLGVKNIRLGPSLPAFVTPAALSLLVERFGIKPIGTAESDLKACLTT